MLKKYLIFSLMIVGLLTGCKSTLTCTLKGSEENYDTEQKIIFTSKKNKIEKAEINYTMIFKDEDSAKEYYTIFTSLDEDYDIKQKKNKVTMISEKDYSKYDQTEDNMRKELENNGYKCK